MRARCGKLALAGRTTFQANQWAADERDKASHLLDSRRTIGGVALIANAVREWLVILETRLAGEALAQLRTVSRVTQVLSPRLAIIQADKETKARIVEVEGVFGVYGDTVPEFPWELSQSEQVFVSAWEERQQPKTRPGEGLSWDSPGFLPPDPPSQRSG
jgi:hypothetical protein